MGKVAICMRAVLDRLEDFERIKDLIRFHQEKPHLFPKERVLKSLEEPLGSLMIMERDCGVKFGEAEDKLRNIIRKIKEEVPVTWKDVLDYGNELRKIVQVKELL